MGNVMGKEEWPHDPWIDGPFKEIYESFVQRVQDATKTQSTIGQYTPHESSHLWGVEEIARRLVSHGTSAVGDVDATKKDGRPWPLSPLERLVLSFSCWLHDLGRLRTYVDEYQTVTHSTSGKSDYEMARDEHEIIGAFVISRYMDLFFPLAEITKLLKCHHDQDRLPASKGSLDQAIDLQREALQENMSKVIGTCIKYHRRKRDIEDCPSERMLLGEPIRLRLIASFLRLADALHIDRPRVSTRDYEMLDLSHTARLHWLKSFAISSISEDPDTREIRITFDVPDQWDRSPKERHWLSMARKFFATIQHEIEEEVYSVNKVFAEAGLPLYLYVRYEIHRIPGLLQQRSKDLWRVLCDVDLSYAQSSSVRLSIFADLAKRLAKDILDSPSEEREKAFTDLIGKIKRENEQQRWCHFGLSNIVEWCERILNKGTSKWIQIDQLFQHLIEYQTRINEAYRDPHYQIYAQDWAVELRKRKVVIVFSKSQSVIGAFQGLELFKKAEMEVIVLEGSPRSRYIGRNTLIYLDGLSYARDLANMGFRNIKLIPDIAVAHILEKGRDWSKENIFVAVGANGINPREGKCYHALGHDTLIRIAEAYDVPVVLFAEDLKIAERTHPTSDHATQRTDSWLFTQVSEDLKDIPDEISLYNPRESVMDIENIRWVITERGDIKSGDQSNNHGLKFVPDENWMLDRKWWDCLGQK
jgi:translation initiation factor 2B subunit (eIF-2B alpha/beta/delta family)